MLNEKSEKIIGISRIIFIYENGTRISLTGDDADKFLADTLGGNRNLQQYNFAISQKQSFFSYGKRFIEWFFRI